MSVAPVTDPVSEVFGYVLVAAAVLLAIRESHVYRSRGPDSWLITRRRYRRRVLVSIVLGLVGAMIAAWGRGVVDFRDPMTGGPNPTPFTIYVLVLTGLSFFLVILAFLDFVETSRNAARHALEEFAIPADKLEPPPVEPNSPTQSEKPDQSQP